MYGFPLEFLRKLINSFFLFCCILHLIFSFTTFFYYLLLTLYSSRSLIHSIENNVEYTNEFVKKKKKKTYLSSNLIERLIFGITSWVAATPTYSAGTFHDAWIESRWLFWLIWCFDNNLALDGEKRGKTKTNCMWLVTVQHLRNNDIGKYFCFRF